MTKKILIVSGEESGDKYGAALMGALRERDPSLEFVGMGGAGMSSAGLKGLDSTELAVVGIVEVIKKIPDIKRALNKLKEMLDREKPDCVVLIDYPDFNLRLAREVKKRGIPVVYYISPQVWAWRKGRVKKIAALVDKMLVVLPFEVDIYKAEGVDVEYVGHPLLDSVKCDLTQDEAKAELGIDNFETAIAILPGSRIEEVDRLMPHIVRAVYLMDEECRFKLRFLLVASSGIEDEQFEKHMTDCPVKIEIIRGEMYRVLRASTAAVVASGTATLETALLGVPMVIVYRLSTLSYLIGKLLIKSEFIGLPNIVAGKKIVPELIQKRADQLTILEELRTFVECDMTITQVNADLKGLAEKLGEPGATGRAADAVMKFVK